MDFFSGDSPMISRSFGTHDGGFHADEVTACCLLLHFNLIDRDKIYRTRDEAKLAECEFVCDVGGIYDPAVKRFDHHQLEYQGTLSSAGMIWRFLLDEQIVDEMTYEYVNQSIIKGIDAHDNGVVVQEEGVCTFSHVIAGFVPIDYGASSEEQTEAFFMALDFALGHFSRLFERLAYIKSCREKVKKAMEEEKAYLFFEEPLPWQENFFELGGEKHPAKFIVMPSGDHWKVRGIPPGPHNRMDVREPLPEEWAGLRDEELAKISGIDGAIFCHKGRFISIWATKEAALEALKKLI